MLHRCDWPGLSGKGVVDGHFTVKRKKDGHIIMFYKDVPGPVIQRLLSVRDPYAYLEYLQEEYMGIDKGRLLGL